MIRGKSLQGGGFVLIEDGHSYVFDFSGSCVQEDAGAVGVYMAGVLEFKVVSVLSSGGHVRIGVFQNGGMEDYGTSLEASLCGMYLNQAGGFLRLLRRDGVLEGARYNQLIFIYRDDADLKGKLEMLHLEG